MESSKTDFDLSAGFGASYIRPTFPLALVLLGWWLLVGAISRFTEPYPIYVLLIWGALVPFFVAIHSFVRRARGGSAGKGYGPIVNSLISAALTSLYAFSAMIMTVNLLFLMGLAH